MNDLATAEVHVWARAVAREVAAGSGVDEAMACADVHLSTPVGCCEVLGIEVRGAYDAGRQAIAASSLRRALARIVDR